MKNDFDKKIKNLFEDASLSDTGFSLDKSAVWGKIETKNKPKIMPFGKMMSHAAALIIGILICLPFLFHSKKRTEQVVTISKTITTPAQIIRDTVFVQKSTNSVALKARSISVQKLTKQLTTSSTASILPTVVREEKKPKEPENLANIQTLIAGATPAASKPKVMYLLDMDNENATVPAKRKEGYSLFKIININANPGDKSESPTMFVGNQLLKSKN